VQGESSVDTKSLEKVVSVTKELMTNGHSMSMSNTVDKISAAKMKWATQMVASGGGGAAIASDMNGIMNHHGTTGTTGTTAMKMMDDNNNNGARTGTMHQYNMITRTTDNGTINTMNKYNGIMITMTTENTMKKMNHGMKTNTQQHSGLVSFQHNARTKKQTNNGTTNVVTMKAAGGGGGGRRLRGQRADAAALL
jgi:hypothetical protein